MSTTIDISQMTAAEIRALAKQREADERAERARQREKEELEKIAAAPSHRKRMADAAIALGDLLYKFAELQANGDQRLEMMSLYHRDYFPAINAFQSHSSAARISKPFFVAECMSDEERAEYEAKQEERREARRAAKE